MKKLDNFSKCLAILKGADFSLADSNDIYRTGVVGQFNLTFELAWKVLQAVLRLHGVEAAETGSPREILQLGYKYGFINDSTVWLQILKKRNLSVHIYDNMSANEAKRSLQTCAPIRALPYDEDEIDELLLLIRDSFIPAFTNLEKTLQEKLAEAGE